MVPQQNHVIKILSYVLPAIRKAIKWRCQWRLEVIKWKLLCWKTRISVTESLVILAPKWILLFHSLSGNSSWVGKTVVLLEWYIKKELWICISNSQNFIAKPVCIIVFVTVTTLFQWPFKISSKVHYSWCQCVRHYFTCVDQIYWSTARSGSFIFAVLNTNAIAICCMHFFSKDNWEHAFVLLPFMCLSL